MLPAVGAASLALDAIQSLTSPASSAPQASGAFGPALSDLEDSTPSAAANSAVAGFGSTQISSDNLNALLNAQSLKSANFAQDANGPATDSSQASASSAALSAYSAINQLAQSTAIPVGLSVSA